MKRFNIFKPIVLVLFVVALLCADASAFGLLEKIGRGRQEAYSSSLSTFIRGRFGRTVIADTFSAFVWQRSLYGVCVPTYATVTKVRVRTGGVWRDLKIGQSSNMWSPGRDANKDYQLELFSWLKSKRRDYCIFEFSATKLDGPVVVETTYEEVIPMYGNKWAYRVPFGWNVGGGSTSVRTWHVDVETDQNFSQPRFNPDMPGIRIEGKSMRGLVASPFSTGEPIIECVEHPDHRNTCIRDEFDKYAHIGQFITPVSDAALTKPRTVSIVLPAGLLNSTGPAQARLLFDALLSRIGPQDRLNIWTNCNPTLSVWKKPMRAHDDNVFAILSLLDQQIPGSAVFAVDNILDSVVVHDSNDSTQHVVVILTKEVNEAAVFRIPRSTPVSIVSISNYLPETSLIAECASRGGTYQHAAWWYGWRSKIPSIADSCLGVSVSSVSNAVEKVVSPEPPVDTELMQGSRRVVYSFDDGRESKPIHPEFRGLVAQTWANERVNRLVSSIQTGVSAEVQTEYIAEIHRIGTTYQLWTPYNPFIE